jgi:hypothetical protein
LPSRADGQGAREAQGDKNDRARHIPPTLMSWTFFSPSPSVILIVP